MTASRPSAGRDGCGRTTGLALIAPLALALAAACATPAAVPLDMLMPGELAFSPVVPDVADRTAAELAAAALASTPHAPRADEAARALARLEAVDRVLVASEEGPTGLAPAAADLVNASEGDARRYRAATRRLRRRGDLDPALERRLELAEEDDPLRLARARMRDSWRIRFARAFNAVAEPVGKSVLNTALAPYRLARGLVGYAVALYLEEALPLQERQALAHWKEFVRRHPDAPESEELRARIASAEARWHRTQRDRDVARSERALESGSPRLALVYADRALAHLPEDARAGELRDAAEERLLAQRAALERSVQSTPAGDVAPPASRPLALALMRPDGDVGGEADALLRAAPDGPLADEARFARALARGEAGDESGMWDALEELADADDERGMARHARALVSNPRTHPYGAFREARGLDRRGRTLWVFFGPWSQGPPRRGLPRPLEWLLGLPSMAQVVFTLPVRLVQLPWMQPLPAERAATVHAARYLRARGDGEYADEVRDWLQSRHEHRDNWIGALRVAESREGADPEEIRELAEKAAHQALAVAGSERRRDVRGAMYRRIAREFPDTEAGRDAGRRAREETLEATPHAIRLTRGFLEENPEVAGPAGIGLRPELLDEDRANGELHREGVALLGGRVIEVAYVDGDDDDPPARAQELLSEERLARLVARLEETSYRNALLDPDDEVVSDAQRDTFFERARLGLADEPDPRATAHASYRYEGMRERYGLVRSRESILPFELVLQGSLGDMSLGAFPRIRPPRETPDAFLYR